MTSTTARTVVRTADVETARTAMGELFGAPMALTADPPAAFRYDVTSTAHAGVTAAAFRIDSSCHCGSDAFDGYTVVHAVAGRHRWHVGNESGNGAVPFVIAPGRDVSVQFSQLRLRTVQFETAEVQRVVESLTGAASPRLRTELLNSGLRHPRLMVENLRFIEGTLVASDELDEAPLIRAQLAHQAILALLDCFPIGDREMYDRSSIMPASMRRALAYIDDHASDPITISDVALAARVSVRTLQAAFRRHLGETPFEYLMRARLSGARADLRAAAPGAAVREIAHRWGFAHSGRFAQRYTAEYGETPSQTLRA